MSQIILDGTGKGYTTRVTDKNRLMVIGVTEDIASHHATDSDGYNYNTGNITLTSANKSAVVYFKNNENRDIIINSFIYSFGPSTNGVGSSRVQVERNPTAGTIISNAVNVAPVNRDFASANTLSVLSYGGVEGDTLTGGTVLLDSLLTASNRHVVAVGAIVLRKGNSIGITITPPASNTSLVCQAAMSLYIVNETNQDNS